MARGAAARAFAKATKAGTDAEIIIKGARRYAAERAGQEPRFTAHAATWLTAERWLDEPAKPNGGAIIDEQGNVVAAHQPAGRSEPLSYSEIAERMMNNAHR